MKRIYIALPFAAFFFVSGVHAGERYIDPIQKKIDEQHKPLVEKYKKTCKAKNKISCLLEAKERASKTVPDRGSVAYSKNNYGKLGPGDAKAKLKTLVTLYDRLEGQSSQSWEGKVTQIQIESEVKWIMSYKLNQAMPDIYSAKMYLGIPLR